MNPIKSLPSRDRQGVKSNVLIEVKPMSVVHANDWHTHIQTLINAHYRFAQAGIPQQNVRADVGWDWPKNLALAYVHSVAALAPLNRSGPALALAIVVHTDSGQEIPIGMLTVVPTFHCTVGNVAAGRGFAWFLADAPAEFYKQVLKVDPINGVATALLDTAIQTVLDAQGNGELLLHADPRGGQKLVDFYTKCGMSPLSSLQNAVSLWRNGNIQQYFHMDIANSAAFRTKYDACR